MRIIFFFSLLIGTCCQQVFCQSFIEVYSGYQLGFGDRASMTKRVINHSDDSKNSEEAKNFQIGDGFNIGIHGSKALGELINVGIGVEYFSGFKTTGGNYQSVSGNDDNPQIGAWTSQSNQIVTVKGNLIQLVPAIALIKGNDKFSGFVKAGIVLGSGSVIHDYRSESIYTSNQGTEKSSSFSTFRESGGVAYGSELSVGVGRKFTKRMSLLGSVRLKYVFYNPSKDADGNTAVLPPSNSHLGESHHFKSVDFQFSAKWVLGEL